MKTFFLLFTLCLNLTAATFNPTHSRQELSQHSQIILGSLWNQLGHEHTAAKIQPIPQKIENDFPIDPDPVPTPTIVKKVDSQPVPKPTIRPKKIETHSRGKNYVLEQLKKNRQKIRDRDKKQKQEKKEFKNLQEEYVHNMHKLKKQTQETYSKWHNTVKETYIKWHKARAQLKKDLPHYKNNTISFESPALNLPKTQLSKTVKHAPKNEYHLIPRAFDLTIRDQGKRATCSSFAGVRAIEVLLASNNFIKDLSEQYFYWSSKPKCQRFPCSKKGSWVRKGFLHSQNSNSPDIPSEKTCPYLRKNVVGNETHTPLPSRCQSGFAKVQKFEKLKNLDETLQALKQNKPVVAGFRLTPNYYLTPGFITHKDSHLGGSMDGHAGGHAMLLVGYMNLPKKLHATEGKVCFLVSNSWGEGWGRGGHGCLSERWVLKTE